MMTDPYIRERVHDVKDLISRLMRHLSRNKARRQNRKLPRNTILIAKSLGPAELLDYDLKKIKGIILEEGSQTMHMVIVTRSMNIPLVCGIKNVVQVISEGDSVAMDATNGNVYLNPSDETLDAMSNRANRLRRLRQKYAQMRDLPATTLDGIQISLNVNAGLSQDLSINHSFDGIGLYRTELPFMLTETLPNVKTQTAIYRKVLIHSKDKPVVFRTLDIGSDKVLPYFQRRAEENPAMGWRSIRMTLDRRALLRNQLRALLQAAVGRDLYIMFPMIATVQEFREAKNTLALEIDHLRAKNDRLPNKIKVGTMLEVPSLIFQLEQLLPEVDFISVGTNDLAQFLYAMDRGNPTVSNRYDTLSPAMLRVMRYICEMCARFRVPCSVCGEMAGRPLEAITLIGLGYRSLSMNPSALGAVKAAVRTLDGTALSAYLDKLLTSASASLREPIRLYASDHDIFIE